MGGTSTDVTCVDGALDRAHETVVAGVRLRAPALAIHTVAAGGGSIRRDDGVRLTVGPESAGAVPGPLCYGDAAAREPTVTDVDSVLGRLADDHFPWPLDTAAPYAALDVPEAAAYFTIANASMAEAVREVTIARGRDVRDFTLVVFGGAGGMHACPVAEVLGIRRVIVPRFAGLFSAWGLGLAPLTWHGERDCGRVALDAESLAMAGVAMDALEHEGRAVLAADGSGGDVSVIRTVSLRYRGSDTALDVEAGGDVAARFADVHRTRFGYLHEARPLEIAQLTVSIREPAAAPPDSPHHGCGFRPRTNADHSALPRRPLARRSPRLPP